MDREARHVAAFDASYVVYTNERMVAVMALSGYLMACRLIHPAARSAAGISSGAEAERDPPASFDLTCDIRLSETEMSPAYAIAK